jgi:hypothetical protein
MKDAAYAAGKAERAGRGPEAPVIADGERLRELGGRSGEEHYRGSNHVAAGNRARMVKSGIGWHNTLLP